MRTTLLYFLIFSTVCGHAQISVEITHGCFLYPSGELYSSGTSWVPFGSDIVQFKKTTTLFILPVQDSNNYKDYEKAIADVWKITPFRIIGYDQIAQYQNDSGYSYFCGVSQYINTSPPGAPVIIPSGGGWGVFLISLTGSLALTVIENNSQKNSIITKGKNDTLPYAINQYYPCYELFIPEKNKKLNIKEYAQIPINYDYDTINVISKNDVIYRYWSPGLMKEYLKIVNDNLENGTGFGLFPRKRVKEPDALKILKTDTLFIPRYLIPYISHSSNTISNDSTVYAEISKSYPFPIQFMTTFQLSDRLLKSEMPTLFMVFRQGKPKHIYIYDSKKGLIYFTHSRKSTDFNIDDLGKITGIVERAR